MYYLTGLLGLISVVAPFALSYSTDTSALWTSMIVGAVLVVVSGIEWMAQDRGVWEYWVAGVAGLTAVAAPFIFGFGAVTNAVWTLVIIGMAAMIASGTKLFLDRSRYGY